MSENIRVLGRLMTEAEMYDLGVPEHYTNVFEMLMITTFYA